MANLGGFAGGLAQGIQSGMLLHQRKRLLDLEDQERKDRAADRAVGRDIQQRELRIREEDHQFTLDERKRAEAAREEINGIFNSSYGVAGPDGKVRNMGDDPLFDFQVGVKMEGAKARHLGVKPEDMMKLAEYGQKVLSTEWGKTLEGALAGDQQALIQLGQQVGFNPASAQLVVEPVKGIYQLQTDKGVIDLKQIARTKGAMEFVKARDEQTKGSRDAVTHDLTVQEKQGNIRQTKVETEQVLPARAAAARAQAAESNAGIDTKKASAEESRARTRIATAEAANLEKGLKKDGTVPGDTTRSGRTLKESWAKEFKGMKGSIPKDPSDPEGKADWVEMHDFMMDRFAAHREKAPNGMAAMTQVNKEKAAILKAVDETMKMLKTADKKAVKEKFGTTDTGKIRKLVFDTLADRNFYNPPKK